MGERSIGVDFASVGVPAVTVSPGSYASGDSAVSAIAFRNTVSDRTDVLQSPQVVTSVLRFASQPSW